MFDGADTSMQLAFVDPRTLHAWIDRVRPHLQKMADHSSGRFFYTDLLTEIAACRMHLWVVIEGDLLHCVFMTEIRQFPRQREMWIIGLVGNRSRRWIHLIEALERAAKENFGCDKICALHMPRFKVMLNGYEPTHWLSEKPL